MSAPPPPPRSPALLRLNLKTFSSLAGGVGPKLQASLVRRAKSKRNWLEDWWEQYACTYYPFGGNLVHDRPSIVISCLFSPANPRVLPVILPPPHQIKRYDLEDSLCGEHQLAGCLARRVLRSCIRVANRVHLGHWPSRTGDEPQESTLSAGYDGKREAVHEPVSNHPLK